MNACARLSPVDFSALEPAAKFGGEIEDGVFSVDADSLKDSAGIHQITEKKIQVYLVADNGLLREALARILAKRGNVDVTGLDSSLACEAGSLARAGGGSGASRVPRQHSGRSCHNPADALGSPPRSDLADRIDKQRG